MPVPKIVLKALVIDLPEALGLLFVEIINGTGDISSFCCSDLRIVGVCYRSSIFLSCEILRFSYDRYLLLPENTSLFESQRRFGELSDLGGVTGERRYYSPMFFAI